MRYLQTLTVTLLCFVCSFAAGRASTFTLPTGVTLTVISMAPEHSTLTLRYRSNVDIHDHAALHAEALNVWRVFQLYAEERGYGSAVLSPSDGPHFTFHKQDGLWAEEGVRGLALAGAIRGAAGVLGTWYCTMTFGQEDDKVLHRGTTINQVDPTGTAIQGSHVLHSPIGTMFSYSEFRYDARRRVSLRVDERPGVMERMEWTKSGARSARAVGSVIFAGHPPIYFRATSLANENGTEEQEHGEVRIKDVWHPLYRETCSRSNATPVPDQDNDPSI
jgi:hypothetical protein